MKALLPGALANALACMAIGCAVLFAAGSSATAAASAGAALVQPQQSGEANPAHASPLPDGLTPQQRVMLKRMGKDPSQDLKAMESFLNRVVKVPLPAPTQATRELHSTLSIADLHADTLLWSRDLLERSSEGHVDLPRLRDGNVLLQVFASVTKVPEASSADGISASGADEISLLVAAQRQPELNRTSLLERSLWHADKLRKLEGRAPGQLLIIRSAADLKNLRSQPVGESSAVGALLAVEGLHNLEGEIENVERLYEAGFRMAAPVHSFDNELGGAQHGIAKGGLTPFGRAVIQALESRKMIVDVAHASPQLLDDILAMATRPVVSSHGGVEATCPGSRNHSDAQLKAIAANGGIIGIGYWEGAVCNPSPASIAGAIAHAVKVAGEDHVALGSDFDGSVATGFDTSQLVHLTQALVDQGLSARQIRKVMGENMLHFLAGQLQH